MLPLPTRRGARPLRRGDHPGRTGPGARTARPPGPPACRGPTGRASPLLRGLLGTPADPAADPSAPGPADTGLAERLRSLPPGEAETVLLDAVRAQTALVLGHSGGGRIGSTATFKELGINSLTALDLRNRLAAATGRTLPATLVFDHPNPRRPRAVPEHRRHPGIRCRSTRYRTPVPGRSPGRGDRRARRPHRGRVPRPRRRGQGRPVHAARRGAGQGPLDGGRGITGRPRRPDQFGLGGENSSRSWTKSSARERR
ncbi:acyl carrier protein [Streptomyces sp. KL116D]|uniref:acyl carrier protein n=1 Tax=Streptomyces sp. KL116D TaxID=3045152 RepID=UPI0035568AD2